MQFQPTVYMSTIAGLQNTVNTLSTATGLSKFHVTSSLTGSNGFHILSTLIINGTIERLSRSCISTIQ